MGHWHRRRPRCLGFAASRVHSCHANGSETNRHGPMPAKKRHTRIKLRNVHQHALPKFYGLHIFDISA